MPAMQRTLEQQRQSAAWLLLCPMIIIIAGVVGYPLGRSVYLSFTSARLVGLSGGDWVGLENYVFALTDPAFQSAIWNTMLFTVGSVGAEMVLGVAVALLLNERFYGRTLMRALLILPWALPTVVNGMMWRLIFNPDFGALNALLTQVGILSAYRSWLGDPSIALLMVALADIWKNFSLVAMIALAALQTVPQQQYQAALIDGASAWKRFWHITLPAIIAPLSVALVLRTIEAFKVFDIIYIMTRGGPVDSTKTVSFFVYQEAFAYMRAGSAASYALIVVAISATLIAVYLNLIRRSPGGA